MGLRSRPPEGKVCGHAAGDVSLWPRSLFGQLFFAVLIGVLAATLISLFLVSRERDRTLVQASVREWSRRVVDMTASMQLLQPGERHRGQFAAAELAALRSSAGRGRHRRRCSSRCSSRRACRLRYRISDSRWSSS